MKKDISRRHAPAATHYTATRITYDSANDFAVTRARLDEQLPLLDNTVAAELVVAGAAWAQVEASVEARLGPQGLVALARLDQGALLSLTGEPAEATLYLVGNPLVARQVASQSAAGLLYAPFRVAVFSDQTGARVSYDQPSSVFTSVGSAAIDSIAAELDHKISTAVTHACALADQKAI
jgi:uncharacterized protein (DUF302 family)